MWVGISLITNYGVKNLKAKIEAGMKFERWTVLDHIIRTPKGERKYLCVCDCGTERYVLERSLLYGGSKSCGCLQKESVAAAISPDLTGKFLENLRFYNVQKTLKQEERFGSASVLAAVNMRCRVHC